MKCHKDHVDREEACINTCNGERASLEFGQTRIFEQSNRLFT